MQGSNVANKEKFSKKGEYKEESKEKKPFKRERTKRYEKDYIW